MPELLKLCLAICPLVFLAGFVDSIAGGGGLISLPAYLVMGLPPHLAAGTNKVVSGLGALTASGKYIKSGRIWLDLAIFSALGALAQSSGVGFFYSCFNILRLIDPERPGNSPQVCSSFP